VKPIHIMRFAPADYVEDVEVKIAIAERDFRALTFYHLFLFHSHIQAGSLPADSRQLAIVCGLSRADAERGLKRWLDSGKIVLENGRLFHKRVVREIAEERAYRAEQAALGKKGGLASGAVRREGHPSLSHEGHPSDNSKGSLQMHRSPPSLTPPPLPAPSPAPAPGSPAGSVARPPEGQPASQAETDRAREMARGALADAVRATGRDPQALLAACSRTPNGRTITSLDACGSPQWLTITAERLASEALAAEEARRDQPPRTAAEKTMAAVRAFVARGNPEPAS
jgi:uncharacterized protein YdaU (DUF1376 family)